MFCVVWGHLCAYCIDNSTYRGKVLTCYTTLFQMPLFLFVSGFFQKTADAYPGFLTRTKKSLKRSGMPYLTYLLLGIFMVVIERIIIGIRPFFDLHIIRGVSSVYWFFVSLLICQIMNGLARLGG